MSQTPISSIGEFGLVDWIKEHVREDDDRIIKGIGDDCAVVQQDPDQRQLISTDTMVEGVHFDLTYTSLRHLGYKLITSTISDIYAMNGTPAWVTISLAIPQKISVELIQELFTGMELAGTEFSVTIIGGDISASSGNFILTATVIGFANPESIIYRSGAQPDDLIVISGFPGRSYAGLKVLTREKENYLKDPDTYQPKLSHHSFIVERHLAPKPRVDILTKLAELEVFPSALIDTSDGIGSDLLHISVQSGCAAHLIENSLPIHEDIKSIAASFQEDATRWALFGGEDYELLFTVPKELKSHIEKIQDVTIIGYMSDGAPGVFLQTQSGNELPLEPGGWNHFR